MKPATLEMLTLGWRALYDAIKNGQQPALMARYAHPLTSSPLSSTGAWSTSPRASMTESFMRGIIGGRTGRRPPVITLRVPGVGRPVSLRPVCWGGAPGRRPSCRPPSSAPCGADGTGPSSGLRTGGWAALSWDFGESELPKSPPRARQD
jgi:hypothetical protein